MFNARPELWFFASTGWSDQEVFADMRDRRGIGPEIGVQVARPAPWVVSVGLQAASEDLLLTGVRDAGLPVHLALRVGWHP